MNISMKLLFVALFVFPLTVAGTDEESNSNENQTTTANSNYVNFVLKSPAPTGCGLPWC